MILPTLTAAGIHDKFQAEAAEKGLEIVADEAFHL